MVRWSGGVGWYEKVTYWTDFNRCLCYFQRSWEKLPKWPTQFGEICSPFFLSTRGDSKSKAKVKIKFPENFGAFYPSENGPLGERLLNDTMHFSCLHLYVICDVVAHDWIHWIKLALRHFGKFWDPFSQWRCKISILPKGCQLVLSKHYYSRH